MVKSLKNTSRILLGFYEFFCQKATCSKLRNANTKQWLILKATIIITVKITFIVLKQIAEQLFRDQLSVDNSVSIKFLALHCVV